MVVVHPPRCRHHRMAGRSAFCPPPSRSRSRTASRSSLFDAANRHRCWPEGPKTVPPPRRRRARSHAVGDAWPELPGAPNSSRAGGVMRQAHPMQVVHLVRHGRTAWNVQRRVMGWLDEGVEPVARRDAEAVADALAGEAVAAIVSSPLRRALQTAGPLANRVGIEPRLDDRVGELRVGPWEGLTEDEIGERWPEEWRRWRNEPHTLALEGLDEL